MEAAQRRLERERKESVELPIEDEGGILLPLRSQFPMKTAGRELPSRLRRSRKPLAGSSSQLSGHLSRRIERRRQQLKCPKLKSGHPEERKTMEASSKKEDGGVKGNGGKRMEEGMEGG